MNIDLILTDEFIDIRLEEQRKTLAHYFCKPDITEAARLIQLKSASVQFDYFFELKKDREKYYKFLAEENKIL